MYKVEITWLNESWTEEEKVVGYCTYEPTIDHRFILSIPLNYRVFETDFGVVKSFDSYKDYNHFLTSEGIYTYRVIQVEGEPKRPLNIINMNDYRKGIRPIVLSTSKVKTSHMDKINLLIHRLKDLS